MGPAGLGTVRQQGQAEALSRCRGGHFPTLAIPAAVAQVVADVGQGVVGPWWLQPQGQVGVCTSQWARGGKQGLTAVGHTQFPIDCRLTSLGEVRYPGFLVGQRVDEIRRLWPFLGRKGDNFRGEPVPRVTAERLGTAGPEETQCPHARPTLTTWGRVNTSQAQDAQSSAAAACPGSQLSAGPRGHQSGGRALGH